jgi:hypothetical protein
VLSFVFASAQFFRTGLRYPLAAVPRALCSADFSRDGQDDVACSLQDNKIVVLINAGGGSFVKQELEGGPNGLDCKDLNSDGLPDIVWGGEAGVVSYVLNRG